MSFGLTVVNHSAMGLKSMAVLRGRDPFFVLSTTIYSSLVVTTLTIDRCTVEVLSSVLVLSGTTSSL